VGWTLFYMLVILKIPLAAALYIVWWAIKEEPAPDEGIVEGGGGLNRKPPPRPSRPRRGPGGAGCLPPPCPQLALSRLERRAPVYARRNPE
jgi:hypothetical protein